VGGLTRFALDNARVTIVFVALIVVFGVVVYLDYPRQEDPTITIREAIVTAAFPGMAPDRVEDLITRPMERAIREIPEVDEIRSDSKTGTSIIHVVVGDQYTDLQPIWQRLRDRMSDLIPDLPSGTYGPFVNDDVGLTAIATIALWTDGFTIQEARPVAEDLRDSLYSLNGIKKVQLFGIQDERVYIEVTNAKLAELGISPGVLVDALQKQNIILPGGTIDASGVNVVIEPSGNFLSVDDIRNLVFTVPSSGEILTLGDIGEVKRGLVDPASKPAYFNGRESIVLSVSINEGVNAVAFGDKLVEQVRAFEQTLPIGYVLEFATFQPDLVEAAVNSATSNVYQTLVIVLVVVMLFLGIRTGFIVGAIVPLSMLFGILVMRFFDIELQRVSIAAMIIALGLLVDNGIVVAEDIRRRVDHGTDKRDAAIEAGRTLALPLLTSSLTTMLAFLPMMLSIGATGEYTKSLSQVVIIVLFCSWFLAMTATPTLCTWLLPVPKPGAAQPTDEEKDLETRGFYRIYAGLLRAILGMRLVAVVVAIAVFLGSLMLFAMVPKVFFPASDRTQFLVYIDLPAGTSVNETERIIQNLTAWYGDRDENPEVTSAIGYVGDGGPRFVLSLPPIDPDPNRGFIAVNTTSDQVIDAEIAKSRDYIALTFPEARGRVKKMWLGNSETGLVQVRVSGPDTEYLFQKGQAVEAAFRAIPGVINVENDWENKTLKVLVQVDQSRAQRAGVTSEEIAVSLSTFISGSEVTDYREGDTVIPVLIRGSDAERGDLSTLQSITVYSPSRNVHVPLTQVARLIPQWQFSRIKHFDQVRTITVSGRSDSLRATELAAALMPALDALDLSPGYRWEFAGEIANSAEAQRNLFSTMPYALAGIVALLIWQFNSFRRPLIIILTVPLSFIGAVAGMLIMNAPFGFMSILGVFSLAGIIINNGIVLIDRIEQERAAGADIDQAIVRAAVMRFRPIVMTTATTVLGLIPLILFGGALWYGLANIIAFGLAVGTVLTLGMVPVFYSLFFNFSRSGKPNEAETRDRGLSPAET
jgi:multidrug efflux pump